MKKVEEAACIITGLSQEFDQNVTMWYKEVKASNDNGHDDCRLW